ncbi:MAG: hypothetical protein LBC20_02410 [Planctomycetaceae bacterium]|jgi:hypothetical protein|nr:hypothetical protein [Planctomycetaceae bacterium]
MPRNHSLLKKITETIFGNTINKTPKLRMFHKRILSFESLENRELLSVTSYFNNDGTINKTDYEARHGVFVIVTIRFI